MRVFRTKHLLASLFLVGPFLLWLAFSALAQNSTGAQATPSARDASFLTSDQADASPKISGPAFSGLATAPPTPVALPSPPPGATPPAKAAPPAPPNAKPADIVAAPVSEAPLPAVSPESIGAQNAGGLGVDMWKGTPRITAEALLSLLAPTESPVLNALVRSLLVTAAPPPEGTTEEPARLTSMRVQKLIAFGAATDAWALAKQADANLVDDGTIQAAAETMLAMDSENICDQLPDLVKTRSKANWQKATIICELRAKDTKAAQVGLDVMRALRPRDDIFLSVADKNLLGNDKNLPFQLTPLTATTLALLRLTGKPLPDEMYGNPDPALVPALMRTSPRQDLAQLALAERAAARGIITVADLASVYRSVVFTLDALASPLAAHETGLRERALLFRAAEGEKDAVKRIAYAVLLVQSASPAFLNGAGALAAEMLGDIKADSKLQEYAAPVAQIYMLADRGGAALDWLRLARSATVNAAVLQKLWPQFVLAGLETASDYDADFDQWLTSSLTPASPQDNPRIARDAVSASLLLLNAAGFKVPDSAWVKVLAAPHNEKHVAFSPVLFDRLEAAGAASRRAETVLLAAGLVGGGKISLPVAVAVTHALYAAGFKSEAAQFARQTVALLAKRN